MLGENVRLLMRSNHHYMYRTGEWGVVVRVDRGPFERTCVHLLWPNGANDRWPVDDPSARYEFALETRNDDGIRGFLPIQDSARVVDLLEGRIMSFGEGPDEKVADTLAVVIEKMVHEANSVRAKVIEEAAEVASFLGCGVLVDDNQGWARPDGSVPVGEMHVRQESGMSLGWVPKTWQP